MCALQCAMLWNLSTRNVGPGANHLMVMEDQQCRHTAVEMGRCQRCWNDF